MKILFLFICLYGTVLCVCTWNTCIQQDLSSLQNCCLWFQYTFLSIYYGTVQSVIWSLHNDDIRTEPPVRCTLGPPALVACRQPVILCSHSPVWSYAAQTEVFCIFSSPAFWMEAEQQILKPTQWAPSMFFAVCLLILICLLASDFILLLLGNILYLSC